MFPQAQEFSAPVAPVSDPAAVERLRWQLQKQQRELDACRMRIDRQLDIAAEVHRSLLPRPIRHPQILVDVRYVPIEQVGGDYCQASFADDDTCFITISDTTGHGIAAALLATRASSEVRYGVLAGRGPRQIVESLNTFIFENFDQTDLYLSFIAARIDLAQRRIAYSGAGHPSPMLLRAATGQVELLASQNALIGVQPDLLGDEPEHTADLAPGDRLVFYTDGLTETADADGRQLGTDGLAILAHEAMSVDLFEMADFILDRVDAHNHGPILDDKTLIVAEVQ